MNYNTLISSDKTNNSTNKYGEISDGFLQEKKSKFISYIFGVDNENMALNYINKIKTDNKEARHVVYIYSYIENNSVKVKFSDDGEPQGTGTRAIYDMLQKESITNICVVIVRYFGGILLGAGPLSRAYLNSFKEAYIKCDKDRIFNYVEYSFIINYSDLSKIRHIVTSSYNDKEARIINTEYNNDVTVTTRIIAEYLNDFKVKIEQFIK